MSEKNNASKKGTGKLSVFLKTLKFIVISYAVCVLLIAVLSALLVYTDLPESITNLSVKVITYVGVFISAFLSARSSNSRGLFWGAYTGGLNIMILTFIGAAAYGNRFFDLSNLMAILAGMGIGAVGGILGINSVKRR